MSDSLIDLLSSPPAPPMLVDEHAVYAGGQARVRRRGWLRGGLAATSAVALVGLAWAVLPLSGGTSILRPGAPATSRVISTSCSDAGTSLGDSGTLEMGDASVTLRARVGTCEGIRVETSYTTPVYAETGVVGSGYRSSPQAIFVIVGMNDQGFGPTRQTAALTVLPPGRRICSLTHAGRPLDDVRDTMSAPQTRAWAGGWTFVAQPLPADADQWQWRLLTCGSDRTLVPANLPPLAETGDPAYIARHPTSALVMLGDGDRVVVGQVDPQSWAIPLTLTDVDGHVLARDQIPPMAIPEGASSSKGWDDYSTSTPGPWLTAGHSIVMSVGGPASPTNTLDTTCGPAARVATARTVVVPGSRLRLSIFDVQALAGGPAPATSLTGSPCLNAGR